MAATQLSIPAVSREYLYLPGIAAFDAASPDHSADPTTLPVQVAFITGTSDPAPDQDWADAEWVDPTTARILIGPDALPLAPGFYQIWLRITGAVEQPERVVGSLSVS